MLGRSDGTLNPNGVRFGSAEIYNIVETFPEIGDSLCVGQKSKVDGEERVLLFLKMAEDNQFRCGHFYTSNSYVNLAIDCAISFAIIHFVANIHQQCSGSAVRRHKLDHLWLCLRTVLSSR